MTARKLACRELLDFIARYLDGELPEEERRVFEDHLANCPYCVDYLASYRATLRLGRAAYAGDDAEIPGDVPPELVEAIVAARDPKS